MKIKLLVLFAVLNLVRVDALHAVSYSNGIDVSKWQGAIDWSQVAGGGISFAFIKATEGVDYVDPYFTANIQAAHAAGVLAGAYHFASPYTDGIDDSVSEANDFAAAIRPYLKSGYLRPVLDLEQGRDYGRTALSAWTCSFISRVKSLTGVEPIVYCNSNYARNYIDGTVSDYNLWVANYTYDTNDLPGTGVWSDWDFWQWSNQGSVPGINARVDLDVCRVNPSFYAIPEPSTACLLLLAAVTLLGLRWIRRR